jgi:hypothetical protein
MTLTEFKKELINHRYKYFPKGDEKIVMYLFKLIGYNNNIYNTLYYKGCKYQRKSPFRFYTIDRRLSLVYKNKQQGIKNLLKNDYAVFGDSYKSGKVLIEKIEFTYNYKIPFNEATTYEEIDIYNEVNKLKMKLL